MRRSTLQIMTFEGEKAFAKWVPYVLRKANHWIRAARRRKKNNCYKFGVEIPRNVAHALELDRKNGNNLWRVR